MTDTTHHLQPVIDRATTYAVAAETLTDHRSVRAEMRGQRVRGYVGERIRAALAARGIPSSDTAPAAREAA